MALPNPVRTRAMRAFLVLSVVGLAACSSSTATGAPAATTAVVPSTTVAPASAAPSAAPSATAPSAAPTEAPATAVPTAIDPCQVIPSQEAGKLAGTTFASGVESTTSGNAKICTYGGSTTNVFMFEVALAPDMATAQADEKSAQAELQSQAAKLASKGLTVTELPNFAPGADAALMGATFSIGGTTLGGRGIYVLHGTTFFGFSDLAVGKAPPSVDAVKAEAMAVLGRLP